MTVDAYKKTEGDNFVRILSGKLIHETPVYSGGVDLVYVPLALNYMPAMKVFFTSDKYPKKVFGTPIALFDPAISTLWNPNALFTVVWDYEKADNRILFAFTNRDTVVRTITVTYQIYSARASQVV